MKHHSARLEQAIRANLEGLGVFEGAENEFSRL